MTQAYLRYICACSATIRIFFLKAIDHVSTLRKSTLCALDQNFNWIKKIYFILFENMTLLDEFHN